MEITNIKKPTPSSAYFSFILRITNALAVMNAPANPNNNIITPTIIS